MGRGRGEVVGWVGGRGRLWDGKREGGGCRMERGKREDAGRQEGRKEGRKEVKRSEGKDG